MDPKTALKVHMDRYGPAVNDLTSNGPESAFLEFMNLSDNPLKVDGPSMHFTLVYTYG